MSLQQQSVADIRYLTRQHARPQRVEGRFRWESMDVQSRERGHDYDPVVCLGSAGCRIHQFSQAVEKTKTNKKKADTSLCFRTSGRHKRSCRGGHINIYSRPVQIKDENDLAVKDYSTVETRAVVGRWWWWGGGGWKVQKNNKKEYVTGNHKPIKRLVEFSLK